MRTSPRVSKLQLNKQTLRVLSDTELRNVGGGGDSEKCVAEPIPETESCAPFTGAMYNTCTVCSNC